MLESEGRKFRPESLSRRGEWTAWAFLLFSAISISLGNWLDENTVIWLESDGIRFENGLRRVRLRWPEVRKVAVLPARWGKAVQVIGEKSHFEFKTSSEVQFRGEVHGILREAGLSLVEESNNAYYYARG